MPSVLYLPNILKIKPGVLVTRPIDISPDTDSYAGTLKSDENNVNILKPKFFGQFQGYPLALLFAGANQKSLYVQGIQHIGKHIRHGHNFSPWTASGAVIQFGPPVKAVLNYYRSPARESHKKSNLGKLCSGTK